MEASRTLEGLTVAVVGAGAVGGALAGALAARGAAVALWARAPGAAARARRRVARSARPGALRAPARLERALGGAGCVVLAVSDGALADAAERVARALPPRGAPAVALHTNGFAGPDALRPLADRGLATGVLHPLAPVPPGAADPRLLEGAWLGLAGDRAALALGRRIAAALGARALELVPGEAARYHAAASLASGGLVALLDAALEPFARAARDAGDARAALVDLCARTLANVGALGPAGALTGAAARGSEALVAAHLEALAAFGGGAEAPAALYRALARRMVALARASGRLDARAARRVLARLEEG